MTHSFATFRASPSPSLFTSLRHRLAPALTVGGVVGGLGLLALTPQSARANDPVDGYGEPDPVEVPDQGPCCAMPMELSEPSADMPDQFGTPYSYDPEGILLAATCSSTADPNDYVFGFTDVSDQTDGTTNYLADHWASAPMFHHPKWTRKYLGEVFGIAQDGHGNHYLTEAAIYGQNGGANFQAQIPASTALVPMMTGGEVWKIDSVTGEPSLLAQLPNKLEGLGNVAFDCETNSLFVTNFHDGKIYRLDPNMSPGDAPLDVYDHIFASTGTPQLPSNIWVDLGNGTMRPQHEVPWGIAVYGGYVYYGVWKFGSPSRVYAVKLDGSGQFVQNAPSLQIDAGMNGYEAYSFGTTLSGAQNPISDIAFRNGNLLLAERGQTATLQVNAHRSRAYEFEFVGGAWQRTLDGGGAGKKFAIGGSIGDYANAAGGVTYEHFDSVDPTQPDGRIWVSSDFNSGPWGAAYGATGVPWIGSDGFAPDYDGQNLFFDFDGISGTQNKNQVGDVELTCGPRKDSTELPCLTTETEIVDCSLDDDYFYSWQLTLTNESQFTIWDLIFEDSANTGVQVDVLNVVNGAYPPLAPGDTVTLDLGVNAPNAEPGDIVCVDLRAHDEDEDFCCTEYEVCFEVPECRDCNNTVVGQKWHDKDGDGVWDANEGPLAGWDITLVHPNGMTSTVTTGPGGGFVFDQVPHALGYTLLETQQLGWTQTYPAGAPNGHAFDLSDPNGETLVLNFGNDKVQGGEPQAGDTVPHVVPTDANTEVVAMQVPAQSREMKLREMMVQIDAQGDLRRVKSLTLIEDLDADGLVGSDDPVLGWSAVEGPLTSITLDEALDLSMTRGVDLIVSAQFGEPEGRANESVAGVAGVLLAGLPFGLFVLFAAGMARRPGRRGSRRGGRRRWGLAMASTAFAASFVAQGACTQGPDDTESFRFAAVKPVATLKQVGHYAEVEGVRDAVGPMIIVQD